MNNKYNDSEISKELFDFFYEEMEKRIEIERMDKTIMNRAESTYKKYFFDSRLDQDEMEDFYFSQMESSLANIRKNKGREENAFLMYCHALMLYYSMEDEGLALEYALDFLYTLAYFIYHSPTKNVEKEDLIVSEFKEIMDGSFSCRENYLKILNLMDKHVIHIDLQPSAYFNCPIIMAVLMELGDIRVARKVKKILIRHALIDFQKLPEICRNQTYLVENNQGFEVYEESQNMAFTFLWAYMKDSEFVAPFCAFVTYYGFYISDIYTSYREVNREDEGFLKAEKIWNQIDEYYQKEENKKIFTKLEHSFSCGLEADHKMDPLYIRTLDFKQLIEPHKNKIILYILKCLYLKLFKEDQIEEIIPMIYWMGIVFTLNEMVGSSKHYIGRGVDVDIQATLQEKDQEIVFYQAEVDKLNHQIELLKKQNELWKNEQNKKAKKEKEKEVNSYKQEVSELRKTIKNQAKEIEKLQENQKELYKLREWMFETTQTEKVETLEESLNDVLETKKIVLVGGHIKFHNKLKERFPKLIIQSVDENLKDLKASKIDHVFIFHQYLSHNLYYKVMDLIMNQDIPWDYIDCVNLEQFEKKVLSKL